jgi:pimeloyl-ACP methyl ester carboxylesterase
MSNVFRELSRDFRVLAFDHPGSPFMEPSARAPEATIEVLARTVTEIVAGRGLDRVHVGTWCVGALVPVWALATSNVPVASLSLIAPPSILGRCRERTAFQQVLLPMVMQLASGLSPHEDILLRKIMNAARAEYTITDATEQAIFDLTHLPVRNEVSTRHYARLIEFMCLNFPAGRDYAGLMDEICARIPVTFLHCRDDEVVKYQCSAEVVTRNPNARLALYPSGSHFVLFKEPAMIAADIAATVRAAERQRQSRLQLQPPTRLAMEA